MNTPQASAAIVLSLAMLSLGPAAAQQQGQQGPQGQAKKQGATSAQVQQVLNEWKEHPRKVAQDLMGKYGPPQEITKQRLIWHNNGDWKRTELINEEIEHNFPLPHKDMLFQVVNFQVPPDKFDDIAAFDGSVIINRTRGEIAAFCDKEPANILALNLAHDIALGKRSVEDARKTYGEQIAALASQKPAPLTEKLTFQHRQDAGFTDRPIMEPTDAQKEQMKRMGAVKQ